MNEMTSLIAVVAVGAALAGLVLTTTRGLRQDMARIESRLDARIGELESRIDSRMNALDARIDTLEQRMTRVELGQAKLEDLLEGLREAISGRAAAH